MKKFDTDKLERTLKRYNRENSIKDSTATTELLNLCHIYNNMLDQINAGGNDHLIYTVYQMSSTIFKQLQFYSIAPNSKQTVVKEENENPIDLIGKELFRNN